MVFNRKSGPDRNLVDRPYVITPVNPLHLDHRTVGCESVSHALLLQKALFFDNSRGSLDHQRYVARTWKRVKINFAREELQVRHRMHPILDTLLLMSGEEEIVVTHMTHQVNKWYAFLLEEIRWKLRAEERQAELLEVSD